MSKIKPEKFKSHIGRAGQFAVMAELAFRGYNVSIPSIDVGDDLYVVDDISGRNWKIQVKSASARYSSKGNVVLAYPQIDCKRLRTRDIKDLFYVIAIRIANRITPSRVTWEHLIFPASVLKDRIKKNEIGTLTSNGKGVQLNLSFNENLSEVSYKRRGADPFSLTPYLNNWDEHWSFIYTPGYNYPGK